MKSITLKLPFPPTANHHWVSFVSGKRVKVGVSKSGQKYRDGVRLEVLRSFPGRSFDERIFEANKRLEVALDLYEPTRKSGGRSTRVRDVDNYVKPLLDALTHARVWEDDGQIDKILVCREEQVADGSVVVRVRTIEGGQE